jgi:lipopolysaccharide transport system ATP-binding protein
MSNTAIKVENLSKRYRIGLKEEIHDTMVGAITDFVKRPIKNLKLLRNLSTFSDNGHESDDTIWALKDVSFEINHGEVVGIIGRNGAGKSTLLKIISRITGPTSGSVIFNGRVSSLLEVGTGFHPELTGRENVYLNGTILGMSKSEIDRKFDEIVAFSEVEKFLDTPVKRYSSGMRVRLAFAIAAHLEPEILLVDEVLAVGDSEFQKKCLGKMGNVAKEGRTVLFVSHNMAAISNLCGRCILLGEGQINSVGASKKVIGYYLYGAQQNSIHGIPGEYNLTSRKNPYLNDKLIVRKVRLLNSQSTSQDTFQMGQEMTIVVDIEGMSDYNNTWIGVIFKSMDDQRLAGVSTGMTCSYVEQLRQKKELAILHIPQLPFTPGTYWIDISVTRGRSGRIDYIDRAAQFIVYEADVYGTGYHVSADYGVIYLNATWEIRRGGGGD